MNPQLKAAFAAAIDAAESLDALEVVVQDIPERYTDALEAEIEAQRTALTDTSAAPAEPLVLDQVTAAELASLLSERPELRDALAPLFNDEEAGATKEDESTEDEESKEEDESKEEEDESKEDESEEASKEDEESEEDESKDEESEDEESKEDEKDDEEAEPSKESNESKESKDSADESGLSFTGVDGTVYTVTDNVVVAGVDYTQPLSHTLDAYQALVDAQAAHFSTLKDTAGRLGVPAEVLDAEDLDMAKLVAAIDARTEAGGSRRVVSQGLAHNTTDSGSVTGRALRNLFGR
jgi:cobalamin biosynthesis protein CobT